MKQSSTWKFKIEELEEIEFTACKLTTFSHESRVGRKIVDTLSGTSSVLCSLALNGRSNERDSNRARVYASMDFYSRHHGDEKNVSNSRERCFPG